MKAYFVVSDVVSETVHAKGMIQAITEFGRKYKTAQITGVFVEDIRTQAKRREMIQRVKEALRDESTGINA